MQQANGTTNGSAPPCPGLLNDAGTVRDACRACGTCDGLIRDMLQDIVAAPVGPKQETTPALA